MDEPLSYRSQRKPRGPLRQERQERAPGVIIAIPRQLRQSKQRQAGQTGQAGRVGQTSATRKQTHKPTREQTREQIRHLTRLRRSACDTLALALDLARHAYSARLSWCGAQVLLQLSGLQTFLRRASHALTVLAVADPVRGVQLSRVSLETLDSAPLTGCELLTLQASAVLELAQRLSLHASSLRAMPGPLVAVATPGGLMRVLALPALSTTVTPTRRDA